MVREANVKQAAAEKQLREAQGKVTTVSSSSLLSSPLVELLSLTLWSPGVPLTVLNRWSKPL